MIINLDAKMNEKLETLSKITGKSTEDVIICLLNEALEEYKNEDGIINPIEGTWFCKQPNGRVDNLGTCYVLKEQKLGEFDCYKIYHNGRIRYAHKHTVKLKE